MKSRRNAITTCLLIGLCFLWTGSAYLTWMYRLLFFYKSATVDILTEVIGYIFQVLGILIFSYFMQSKINTKNQKILFSTTMGIDFIFAILATLSPSGVLALVFGYSMNLFHGFVAGFYLTKLVQEVPQQNRGLVFGVGYGIGSLGSWLLSLMGEGNFLKSNYILIIYAILIAGSIALSYVKNDENSLFDSSYSTVDFSKDHLLLLAGISVLLLSLVKNIGFYFPMADIASGNISLEFTRVFYAIGLIAAGLINDKSRKLGAICCVAALVFPFILLALPNYTDASAVLWIIGYSFFGFFVVYRVVLFADIAGKDAAFVGLAALGLMWGRIGDVLGALLGILLTKKPLLLTSFAGACFIITIFVFFQFYHKVYLAVAPATDSIEQRINRLITQYALSSREEEVARLIIDGLSNTEIASALFISENTVKFHVKNVLKKTSCSNRTELIALVNKTS